MDLFHLVLYYIFDYQIITRQDSGFLYTMQEGARWFLICFAIFAPLALLMPGKRGQPVFHKSMIPDTIYWFFFPMLYRPIYMLIIIYLLTGFYAVNHTWLDYQQRSIIATWPVWLQVILMLLATDILQYWAHRLFHKWPLWKFHAIHHSSETLDWLSSARFHPVNIILYSTLMNALVFLLGFSADAYNSLNIFNALYSPLVHANLNWTYGPFKYVLASPVFHRWHHTYQEEGGDKNFAPTFPFLDVMFGTFYMPKDKTPQVFGTPHDKISDANIFQQLIYPFMPSKAAEETKPAQAPASDPNTP